MNGEEADIRHREFHCSINMTLITITYIPLTNRENSRSPNTWARSFPLRMYHHMLRPTASESMLRSARHPPVSGPFFTMTTLSKVKVTPNQLATEPVIGVRAGASPNRTRP